MGRLFIIACTACLPATCLPAQTLNATLVANDAIYANWVYLPSGALGFEDSVPAGPITSAAVQANYGTSTVASYSCDLQTAGDGYRFEATTQCLYQVNGIRAYTHADLTLQLTAAPDVTIGLAAHASHGGDHAANAAISVDLGDDGLVELDSGCPYPCGHPTQHRLWTWSFSDGPLSIRIRTDQMMINGAQGYGLTLDITPWATAAAPVTAGCGGIAGFGFSSFLETSNYGLSAESSNQPGELMVLRATGLGAFDTFLVSMDATTTALQLPSPFSGSCDVLANSFALVPGTVSAMATVTPSNPIPREWTLTIPVLPPGLTFYAQHASAEPNTAGSVVSVPPAFGATGVLRIDT